MVMHDCGRNELIEEEVAMQMLGVHENENTEESKKEIAEAALQSMMDLGSTKTSKLKGTIGYKEVVVLIYSEKLNFISTHSIQELQLPMTETANTVQGTKICKHLDLTFGEITIMH